MRLRSCCWLLSSLMLVIEPRWTAAQVAKWLESDKVAKIAATLVDLSESKDLPLEMEARPGQDQRATVLLSILGRYRAAVDVVAQD